MWRSYMKVKAGYIVKVADIGPSATVKKTGRGKALVQFIFPEGRTETVIPMSLITDVISRGEANEPVRI